MGTSTTQPLLLRNRENDIIANAMRYDKIVEGDWNRKREGDKSVGASKIVPGKFWEAMTKSNLKKRHLPIVFSRISERVCAKSKNNYWNQMLGDEWRTKKLAHIDDITWIDTDISCASSQTHIEIHVIFSLSLRASLLCCLLCLRSMNMFSYVCVIICLRSFHSKIETNEKMGESQEAKDIIFGGYHFQRQRTMCIIPTAEQDVRLGIYFVCVFGFLYHTTNSCTHTRTHALPSHWNHTFRLTYLRTAKHKLTFAGGLLLSPKN